MTDVIELGPSINEFNPLDSVEDILIANDWTYQRVTDEELFLVMAGDNGQYDIMLQWVADRHALRVCCRLQETIPDEKVGEAILVSNEINQELWAGHFSLDPKDPCPAYYNTILLSREEPDPEKYLLTRFVEGTLEQCERYAPLYHWLSQEGSVDQSAMTLLSMEEAGRA